MKLRKLELQLKEHFKEVIRVKTSAHSIALGFSIGTFIGILPTPGFNILLALLVLFIFERVNKISLFAGILIWNPITSIPIYVLSYKLGNILFSDLSIPLYNSGIVASFFSFSRRFLFGNILLALIISMTSYIIVRTFVAAHYRKANNSSKL